MHLSGNSPLADVVSAEVRSRMMAGIRSKHTKPEMIVRRGLHRLGFRYRLHDKRLPGKPDLVLSRYRVAIFVNGCFWHGHNCPSFKWPKTRVTFWMAKIESNRRRDEVVLKQLHTQGWYSEVIWECQLGRSIEKQEHFLAALANKIRARHSLSNDGLQGRDGGQKTPRS